MKLIESNVEYIPQAEGLEGIYRQIEIAGRTAYKSEDKIVDVVNVDIDELPVGMNIEDIPSYKDNPSQCISFLKEHNIEYRLISSARKFTDMLIRNKHYAALEHGTVYLKREVDITDVHNEIFIDFYKRNPYSKVVFSNGICYITTNLRVLQENNCLDDLKYICEHTETHEKRYTFKFTCDRGISHELVRHRAFSFLQESTRYCNYMMDKFGNQVTFIIPSWSTSIKPDVLEYSPFEITSKEAEFMQACFDSEKRYLSMLKSGATPQEARAVLPNALKTELVMTGFASDWRNLLDIRYFEKTGKVHPDMAQLMQKLAALMHVTGVWDDVMKYPSKFE